MTTSWLYHPLQFLVHSLDQCIEFHLCTTCWLEFSWRTPGNSVKMMAFLGKTERLRKTFSFTSSLSFFFSRVLPLLHLYFPLSALSSPLLCFLFLHFSLSQQWCSQQYCRSKSFNCLIDAFSCSEKSVPHNPQLTRRPWSGQQSDRSQNIHQPIQAFRVNNTITDRLLKPAECSISNSTQKSTEENLWF